MCMYVLHVYVGVAIMCYHVYLDMCNMCYHAACLEGSTLGPRAA